MFARLFTAIWALVLTLVGATFAVIGLASSSDETDAFGAIGLAMLAAGLVLGAVAYVLQRRHRAARQRRMEGGRAPGEVVSARLHPHTRVGVLLTYTATIRFAADDGVERDRTKRLLVPPTKLLEPGGRVEVAYDRADPDDFELL